MSQIYLYHWRNQFNLKPTAMIYLTENIICWWQEKDTCKAYIRSDSIEDAYDTLKLAWPEILLSDLIEACEKPYLNIPNIDFPAFLEQRIKKFGIQLH